MVLIRVCAWCGKYKGFELCEGVEPVMVSHGICDECAKRGYMQIANLGAVILADDAQLEAGRREELGE